MTAEWPKDGIFTGDDVLPAVFTAAGWRGGLPSLDQRARCARCDAGRPIDAWIALNDDEHAVTRGGTTITGPASIQFVCAVCAERHRLANSPDYQRGLRDARYG